MGSPFGKKVAVLFPITDAQLDLLCKLQRQILELDDYGVENSVVYMDAFELQARQLSKSDASTRIDVAIAQVREAEVNRRQRAVNKTSYEAEDIDGFWELPDGAIVKVQIAVHGSGRPYGKILNTDTGKFTYDERVISQVRSAGTRLTLERAKELGQLYGMCVRCGATLTDEDSIAAGIGPWCAKKF